MRGTSEERVRDTSEGLLLYLSFFPFFSFFSNYITLFTNTQYLSTWYVILSSATSTINFSCEISQIYEK